MKEQLFHIITQDYITVQGLCLFQCIVLLLHHQSHNLLQDLVEITDLMEINHVEEEDNFYPMTAFDDDGIVGSFIMRYIKGDKKKLRFGWVINDPEKRGKGYGKAMLQLGFLYAFEVLHADKVTIGVYEDNLPAYKCYESIGFHKGGELEDHYEDVLGEKCKVVELEIKKEEWQCECH